MSRTDQLFCIFALFMAAITVALIGVGAKIFGLYMAVAVLALGRVSVPPAALSKSAPTIQRTDMRGLLADHDDGGGAG